MVNQTAAIAQLRGLLDVMRLVHDEEDLPRLLDSLARTISESLGFGTVVINLYRPAWDDFEVTTVHGSEAARQVLHGERRPREAWSPLLDERFLRCGAYVIPHGTIEWNRSGVKAFVPDALPGGDAEAWHPEDALLVPMLHSDGSLLGILSVDEPVTGRTPSDEELDVLTAVAAHAALALQSAQEAAEAARHRRALEQLLQVSARLTESHHTDEVLREVVEAIHAALGFEKVSIDLLDRESGRFRATAAVGWDLEDVALSQLEVERLSTLLAPDFDVEGCYLLPAEEALARVGGGAVTYSSVRNGRGPRAWKHHWLLVPLADGDGEIFGVIWVDDPADRLLPSRQLLQALRMFANQATTALVAAGHFEALFESEQRRLAAAEASPLAIFELDLDWHVRTWNPAAEQIFGWRADEVIGRPNPIVPEGDASAAGAAYRRVLAGESLASEVRRRRKDGSLVDVKLFAAPLRDTHGNVCGVSVTGDDIDARKRAEALKSAILESAPDCVILLEECGRILEFNPKAEETFGWMRDEALAMNVGELLELEDGLETVLPDALLGIRHELVAVRADGTRFPVEVAFAPVPGAGEPVYTAYLRDVTKRRRSDERLREMEAKYRTLVEGLPLVTYVNAMDDDVVTTYISPQIQTLLGYPVERWYERGFFLERVHPEDRERVREEATRARRGRTSFRSEYRLVAAEGSVVSVLDETVVVADQTGQPLFLQGYLLDLTERRRADDALRRSEELYRLVVENSHDVISLVDANGIVHYTSPSAERMLGRPVDEIVGTPLADMIHPEDLPRVQEYLETTPDVPTRVRVRHADGRWLTIEGLASKIEFEGEPMGLTVVRDVTENDKLEQQLRQAQKMEAVGRLAGGVAHDFNNLLTAIGGFADYLLKGLNKDDPLRNDALEVKKAADRAGELTQQLLAFSRQQVMQARLLDPREIVSSVEGLLRRLIGEDIELVLELSDAAGAVKADRGQLEQVIVNLALNARDAMPGGGRLSIAVRPDEHAGAPAVLLEVADTGVGFDEETRERLFEPFFTTKEAGKGTGLGLATVLGIVEQSGGAIDVRSERGVGTAFRIFLPVADGRPELVPVAAPAPEGERSSGTVLLVEDEDAVRTLARRILTAEGYTVLEAANGTEALELAELRGGQIDLLVTDVVMPGLSGREVADALSASRPALRVLYMSGYTEDTIVHHGVRDPDVVFLDKPFTPAELARAAREALEGGHALKAARVLLVEDDEQLRELIRTSLSEAGYKVLVARDANHAVRIAEEEREPIELLLTDVFMPRMDGRELSNRLSTLHPELRILYMSGKPADVLLDRGVIASGGRFVQKPFGVNELLARVRATLAEPGRLSA